MTNSDQPTTLSSSPSNSLQFPTISEMDNDSQSEDGLNSLSDGNYEIISHSSFHTSDDESHDDGDDSMVSFGALTPEEGSSVDGDDYLSAQHVDAVELPPITDDGQLRPRQQNIAPSLGNSPSQSIFSSRTVTKSHDEWIQFKEPINGVASGLFDVTQNVPLESNPDPSSGIRTTVQKTLASHTVRLNGPFRIMFNASNSEAHLKHAILEKIGQALHLSTAINKTYQKSTQEKLNIVPISAFGSHGAAPEVMLLPYTGLQIEVEDCSGSFSCAHNNDQTRASESESTGQPRTCEAQNRKTPDLAIFVHRSLSSDPETLMLDLARSDQLKRRGTPVIDICADSSPNALATSAAVRDMQSLASLEFKPSKERAVHVTYKTITESKESFLQFKTPIDLQTFQQLDPLELNRNIAAITGADSILNFQDAQWLILSWTKVLWLRILLMYSVLSQLWYQCSHWVSEIIRSAKVPCIKPHAKKLRVYIARLRKDILFGLVVGLSICSALWIYQHGQISVPAYSQPLGRSTIATTPASEHGAWPTHRQTLPAPAVPPLLSAPPPIQRASALTAVHTETGLSIVPTLHKISTKRLSKTVPEYKLLEAEDGRLFLRSKPLSRKWKRSATLVQAFQQDRPLEVTLSKVDDTMFEIHLAGQIHYCAPIVVTIWPSAAQTATQTFQVSRPCLRTFSCGNLLNVYSVVRSRIIETVPKLGDMVYQQALGLSHEAEKRLKDSYNGWTPKMSRWTQHSLTWIQKLSNGATEARIAFNAMADDWFDSFTGRLNENVEAVSEDLGYRISVAQAIVSNRYKAARLRARHICAVGVSKALRRTNFQHDAPASVKVARSRAILFKDRMTAKGAKLWRWAARSHEKLQKFAENQTAPSFRRRSRKIKKRCRGNRKGQSN